MSFLEVCAVKIDVIGCGFPVEWFISPPPERTKCTICKNVLNKPRFCKSGHLFCLGCIRSTMKDDGTSECLICESVVIEKDLVISQFAQEVVAELMTRCTCHFSGTNDEGCGWIGMLKERIDRSCDYQLQKCPNDGCEVLVQHRQLQHHLDNDCARRHCNCKLCNLDMKVSELIGHEETCCERLVKCTGCQTVMPLSKMDAHHDNDCALNFIDCPLFKVGMCTAECTGRVRVEDSETHSVADASLTTRLVDEILRLRTVQSEPSAKQQSECEIVSCDIDQQEIVRKRPRENGDLKADNIVDATSPVSGQSSCLLRTLFVDRLALKTTESELRSMFEQFGCVERVVFPSSSKSYVFVTMSSPLEAQRAVVGAVGVLLNGSNLQVTMSKGSSRVCYEWENRGRCKYGVDCTYAHPVSTVGTPSQTPPVVSVPSATLQCHVIESQTSCKRPRLEDTLEPGEVPPETSLRGDTHQSGNIYVGHLSYATSETTLRDLFSRYGKVTRVHIGIDPYGKPRGYAFVAMQTPEEAQFAVERANGTLLDGYTIQVSIERKVKSKQHCFEWENKSTCKIGDRCLYAHTNN